MQKPRESQNGKARDIVVIGGSAGSLTVTQALLEQLDPAIPAALFLVIHQSSQSPGTMPTMLARSSRLPIVSPADGTPIRTGHVYVAPPNAHLAIQDDRVRVLRGPAENMHRPSIDTLFRSAAVTYGPRVVGVVLSGSLDDGTAGLEAIKSCGGVTVVQSPQEAPFPSMPNSALAAVSIDHCLPVSGIASLLGRLAATPLPEGTKPAEVPDHLKVETDFALMARDIDDMDRIGPVSSYICPTCNGSLWEVDSAGMLRFRCHVGHAFSAEALLAEQGYAVERALYTALRLLEERGRAARQLANRRVGGDAGDAFGLEARSAELEETARVLRRLVVQAARLNESKITASEPEIEESLPDQKP